LRLAKAFKKVIDTPDHPADFEVALVSNQPIADQLKIAFERAAVAPVTLPRTQPRSSAADEIKLGFASGLSPELFHLFAKAMRLNGGAGSRFRQEEELLRSVSLWTDLEVLQIADRIRRLVANFMRPERANESITRETVLAHLGVSEQHALFPCPPALASVVDPVPRRAVRQAVDFIVRGSRHVCIHGRAGAGKTTALQTLAGLLPFGSVLLTFDCYGGGHYFDSNALRHRPQDAFLHLANELATVVGLPMLLGRQQGTDYPRAFSTRVDLAAQAISAANPGALLVIAVDAADNSVSAAAARSPPEPSFITDFVALNPRATNVRLIVTARTGRLDSLGLPRSYEKIELDPFSLEESAAFCKRYWAAPDDWIKDFHELSGGVPRVQAYAFAAGGPPEDALGHLLPGGKDLGQLFREQFNLALSRGGPTTNLAALCAALSELPRPIPISDLAGTLDMTELGLTDVCGDLAPGVRLWEDRISFADEDFEQYVRAEGEAALMEVRRKAATWLDGRRSFDSYAAQNVAAALLAAGRRTDLLDLVEAEPAPSAIKDPVLRREAEIQRLRLAIKASREAGDVVRALRFVLIGAEGIGNERGLRALLESFPDLTARFSRETGARLILRDPRAIAAQGPLMFHVLAADAAQGDTVGLRQGSRQLQAWLLARHDRSDDGLGRKRDWPISAADIAAEVDAVLRSRSAAAALAVLGGWTPKAIKLEVVRILPPKLLAEGRADLLEQLAIAAPEWSVLPLFITPSLAAAARPVDISRLVRALGQVYRRGLAASHLYSRSREDSRQHYITNAIMAACELLTARGQAPDLIDKVLLILLEDGARRIEDVYESQTDKLDIVIRAYCLQQSRQGRVPNVAEVLLPRCKDSPPPKQDSRSDYHSEQHDREMLDMLRVVLPIYAATAAGLAGPPSDPVLQGRLVEACRGIKANKVRSHRDRETRALRDRASVGLLSLLVHGYEAHILMDCASWVSTRWEQGVAPPPVKLVAALSVRAELHGRLVTDLSRMARTIRSLRMGAERKAGWLADVARMLTPLSPDDAQAVFNLAVDAAGDLDTEVMAQIKLLERLLARGQPPFPEKLPLSLKLADITQDAAIRLESNEAFPWREGVSALAALSGETALAVSCRWADEDIASLDTTLAPLLPILMKAGFISPSELLALAPLVHHDADLPRLACTEAVQQEGRIDLAMREMAARDAVVRARVPVEDALMTLLRSDHAVGTWTSRLIQRQEFASAIEKDSPEKAGTWTPSSSVPVTGFWVWDDAMIGDASALSAACDSAIEQSRKAKQFVGAQDVLAEARANVSPRSRIKHLRALAVLEHGAAGGVAIRSLLGALNAWRGTAAVDAWCVQELPDIILRRFPDFSAGMVWGDDMLPRALDFAGLRGDARQDILLRALEAHVDFVGANLAFDLAALIGAELVPDQAASLATWYIERLAARMAPFDSNVPTAADVPKDSGTAVARLLFSQLGDVDHSRRWRAAHCVRRLARVGSEKVSALLNVYDRTFEPAFCGRNLPFYWLAARLWLVIALRRSALENPMIVMAGGPKLLAIATDQSLPHLLIRAHARAACNTLITSGHFDLDAIETAALASANQSPFDSVISDKPRNTRPPLASSSTRRFYFDQLDTVPYWYQPLAEAFVDCGLDHFQDVAERWILDAWKAEANVWEWEREPRKGRDDIARSHHGHGEVPTVERFSIYLQWHAMWCAAGELLRTKPLRGGEDSWGTLSERMNREMPGPDEVWAADLLRGVPLQRRYWQMPEIPLDDWLHGIREPDLLAELMPPDAPGFIVVSAWIFVRSGDRREQSSISSALVAPSAASSLVRALQTVEDPLDYHLPDEDEGDSGVDTPPFHLRGWLSRSRDRSGFDEKDPLRGSSDGIAVQPGLAVCQACALVRAVDGSATWSKPDYAPMFVYEVWGDDDANERQSFSSYGRRLLCSKDQLSEFLRSSSRDLIVEVEVQRNAKSRSYHQEEAAAEERHDRLYLLRGDGRLDVAEGRTGTWTADRPTT
jgi:hypothetical protein